MPVDRPEAEGVQTVELLREAGLTKDPRRLFALALHHNSFVRRAVARNGSITLAVYEQLSRDEDSLVRDALDANPATRNFTDVGATVGVVSGQVKHVRDRKTEL